ncbi:transposase, partial [Komagataeibacter oboediens]|uniref:transposase n=1 Tax=Komagataeibacter oboediens TaxID=65958 RepID=UPI00215F492D
MSDLRDRDAVLPASVAGSTAERLQRSGRETGERDRLAGASRIEIVSDRRRWHAPEFRARVVIASYESRRPIREVAAQYGIHPSLVFRWRREARAKGGTSFIPGITTRKCILRTLGVNTCRTGHIEVHATSRDAGT